MRKGREREGRREGREEGKMRKRRQKKEGRGGGERRLGSFFIDCKTFASSWPTVIGVLGQGT